MNLYSYVGGDPINYYDIYGLDAQSDFREGAADYFKGMGYSAEQIAGLLGAYGDCEALKAYLEALAASAVEAGFITETDVRDYVVDEVIVYAKKNPARTAGNLYARASVGFVLGGGGNPAGAAASLGLNFISTHGTLSKLIRDKLDELCSCPPDGEEAKIE